QDIVAQRLHLEPAISEDVSPVVSQQHIVRIDVEAALREYKAHTQIVATHRWVAAARECLALAFTICIRDVCSRGGVVDNVELKAFVAETIPTIEADADVFWQTDWVVPVPDNPLP